MKKNIRISIVIVNYNSYRYLKECIKSILANTHDIEYEVIIIDNNSTDNSVSKIKKEFDHPNIHILENDQNYGPAQARNKGIFFASGEYTVFLDNDTKVTESWLDEPLDILDRNKSIAACQLRLMLLDDPDLVDSIGEYMGRYGFLVPCVEVKTPYNGSLLDGKNPEIFAAKSAGMISRTSVLRKIKGFDKDFFIYVEETDIAWKMLLLGYKIVLCRHSVVYHKFGTSCKILSPEKHHYLLRFHGTKNYITTLLKNLSVWNSFKIIPKHIALWTGLSLWLLIHGKYKDVKYINKGMLWVACNFFKIIKKRRFHQGLRKISDEEIFKKTMNRSSLISYYKRFTNSKPVGHSLGWDRKAMLN